MGSWYDLSATTRLSIHAQAGRNGPTIVLVVKDSLVTMFGMYISTGAAACVESWSVSDPFREQCVEVKRSVDDEHGQDLDVERWEHVLLPSETFASDNATIFRPDSL